jgi:pimeloyl-ACP methyl ester carboxylesterase
VLHGYFYRARGGGKRPAVIMHSGFDGSCEEMHFIGAAAAVERGYHVLSFDGPGQPAARHRDGLVFRPDWERVVTPVFDWLVQSKPEVDARAVSLLGVSMGGLLAPRAAAFEPRLAACIAIDGVYDLGVVSTRLLPMPRDEAAALLRAPHAPELDAMLDDAAATNPTARWAFGHGMYVMGVQSPRAFLAAYLDYDLSGIAGKIRCPTLVCDPEEDLFFQGQPEALYEQLTCPKTLMRFSTAEGAGAHCHPGAQRLMSARVYDWLDETLARR